MTVVVERLDSVGCLSASYETRLVQPSQGESGSQGGFSAGLAVETESYRVATITLQLNAAQADELRVLLGRVGSSGQIIWKPEVPPNTAGVTASMPTIMGTLESPVPITWIGANTYTARVAIREDI